MMMAGKAITYTADDVAAMAGRILEHYRDDIAAMDDARAWYANARAAARRLAREHGTTVSVAAGVIAALSPRCPWGRNVIAADIILGAARRGDDLPSVGLKANARKAFAIASGAGRPLDILRGPKVRSFYRNILGDVDAVTVDVWAARAAGVDSKARLDGRRYDHIADAYRYAARIVGVAPAVLQAIVWVSIRGTAA